MPDYLFIGDIHSQDAPLGKALGRAREQELVPVLLGDIWDTRCHHDGTLRVMDLILNYPSTLLLCQSNHQWEMLRYLRGETHPRPWFLSTLNQIGSHLDFVKNWFEGIPFGYALHSEVTGTVYKVAHAQFPSKTTSEVLTRQNTSRKERELCLWGGRDAHGDRARWWLNPRPERPWVRVGGHYHAVHVDVPNKNLVLDSNCGETSGCLTTFNTRTHAVAWETY